MPKKGLIFIHNEYPNNDKFIYRKKYRYIPTFGRPTKTIIDLELYPNNICVLSFYEHNKGNNKTKYRVRTSLGPGVLLKIYSFV